MLELSEIQQIFFELDTYRYVSYECLTSVGVCIYHFRCVSRLIDANILHLLKLLHVNKGNLICQHNQAKGTFAMCRLSG